MKNDLYYAITLKQIGGTGGPLLRLHVSMEWKGSWADPGWGNSDPPAAHGMAKKKKKRNNIEKIMDQPYLSVLVFKMSIEFILAIILFLNCLKIIL